MGLFNKTWIISGLSTTKKLFFLHRAIKQDIDDHPAVKKQKIDPEDAALEKTIETQNKEYYKLRDKLESVKKPDRIAILEANHQYVPEGNSEVLDHTTDILYFGALKRCDTCAHGQFIFNGNSAYACTGEISEWAKCDNISKEPKREVAKVPKYLQDQFSFLAKKFKVRTRALKSVPAYTIPKAKVKKEGQDDIDA